MISIESGIRIEYQTATARLEIPMPEGIEAGNHAGRLVLRGKAVTPEQAEEILLAFVDQIAAAVKS